MLRSRCVSIAILATGTAGVQVSPLVLDTALKSLDKTSFLTPQRDVEHTRVKRAFDLLDTMDAFLGTYGCWCPRLVGISSHGGKAVSEIDGACRQWSECRKCQDYVTCDGDVDEDYTPIQNSSGIFCEGMNECTTQICKCDVKYVELILELTQKPENLASISTDVNLDASDCKIGGPGGGTPSGKLNTCCGDSPDWKLYSTDDGTCDSVPDFPGATVDVMSAESFCGQLFCNETACATPCTLTTGYYPDANDCRAFCFCAGPEQIHPSGLRTPSRYQRCNFGLVFDPFCRAPVTLVASVLSLPPPDDFGTEGGCCRFPRDVQPTDNICDNGELMTDNVLFGNSGLENNDGSFEDPEFPAENYAYFYDQINDDNVQNFTVF